MAKGSTGTSMGGTIEYVSFKDAKKTQKERQAQKQQSKKKQQKQTSKPQTDEKGKTSQKQRKNCYAIHYLDGENVIVKTWAECQKRTKGRANMFKGFASEAEAFKWLESISPAKESVHQKQAKKAKENKRVLFKVHLDHEAAIDFQKRLDVLKMTSENLIENLILEYLYDIE